MREQFIAIVRTWGISLILFASVLCLGIAMIFARPQTFYETPDKMNITVVMQSGVSFGGLGQLGSMWVAYPNYFAIGASVAAIGVLGMGFSLFNIFREWDRVNEEV